MRCWSGAQEKLWVDDMQTINLERKRQVKCYVYLENKAINSSERYIDAFRDMSSSTKAISKGTESG